jgi:acyl carrier protein
LGIDSLDRIELLFELEERFGIEIPDEVLSSICTIGDLLAYLHSRGIELPAERSCA